ncbi:MAG: hypothetical protein H6730_07910 [Deltaproteobacteria bacterium]|nr:hypothetical protein [Deltaproteobacteria bacterium]
MATEKKSKKPAKAKAAPAPEPADPTPPPAPEPEAAPEPEEPPAPQVFLRDAEARDPEEEKAIRGLIKKGEKALEAFEEVLACFEPGPERAVKNALKRLAEELDALKPPEPRKCKEYKRALALARKGEMGIHPDDVMKYCRCEECTALRAKAGVDDPLTPRSV